MRESDRDRLLAELLGRRVECSLIPSRDDHRRALRDEPAGRGQADAAVAAGDQGGLASEFHGSPHQSGDLRSLNLQPSGQPVLFGLNLQLQFPRELRAHAGLAVAASQKAGVGIRLPPASPGREPVTATKICP